MVIIYDKKVFRQSALPNPALLTIRFYFLQFKKHGLFKDSDGIAGNCRFNSIGNRAYIITHSLKKMKKEDRDIALNPTQFIIEENFRIMKTEFEARPVYVRREDRIKAHFMTCYISLLLYRLLEKKLGNDYTSGQILETLRGMQLTLLNTASGYITSYTRTELTDTLHKAFGFRTDYEFITKSSMRSIIKEKKQIKAKTS